MFTGIGTKHNSFGKTNRIGVTQVLIEWKDYQSECFGELIFTKKQDEGPTEVINS